MTATKTIELEFDIQLPLGTVEKTVVSAQLPVYANYEILVDSLVEMAEEARKNIASRHLDFEASGGDSQYLDMLDRMADGYGVTGLRIQDPSSKPRRYAVEAEWPDADNSYSDYVFAVSPLDAQLQFAWLMAVGTEHGERSGATPKGFEEVVDYMSEIETDHVEEEPVTLEEAVNLLQDFYVAQQTDNDLDGVLDRVRAALESLDMLPDLSSGPRM